MNSTTPPQQQNVSLLVSPPRNTRSVLRLVVRLAAASSCTSLGEFGGKDLHCPDSIRFDSSQGERGSTTRSDLLYQTLSHREGDPTDRRFDDEHPLRLREGTHLAKDIPATKQTGGGEISETTVIPIHENEEESVKICMTATDQLGNERPITS